MIREIKGFEYTCDYCKMVVQILAEMEQFDFSSLPAGWKSVILPHQNDVPYQLRVRKILCPACLEKWYKFEFYIA